MQTGTWARCSKASADERKTVNSLMYCPEQIVIPDSFPNILKNYAKAAIRTQPYDLLRWSVAYFRCLAQNEPPPAKCRLEKDTKCGTLTKGYLQALLNQVGKGFFLSREVLQKKWEGLCLPEEELLKYLSLCRMINWEQVHWLKVFAVMVGSLNESPENSMVMLCEMLSDDVEGGAARIPMWMFRTVYTYIAELDCSEEQVFVDGCLKLGEGDFEPETVMDHVPKVFSTTSLKQRIMNECVQRYNEEYEREGPRRLRKSGSDSDSVSLETKKISATDTSSVDSGFQFAGKPGDTKQIIQKCGDFDSLILLLREAQGAKLHEYEGSYHVTQANIEHAKRREAKIDEDRELRAMRQEENTRKYLHLENVNMLREMGPPWTWIHQFINNNCVDMSYNFIEEGSIASDVTPPDSSDESFDFVRERPVSTNDSESETHLFSTSTDNVEDLVKDEKATIQATSDKKPDNPIVTSVLQNTLMKPLSEPAVDLSDASSIVSYINKDEVGVLLRGGERAVPNFNIEILDQILRDAMLNGKVFESIDEVMEFVKDKYDEFTKDRQTEYFVKSGFYQTLQAADKINAEEVRSEEMTEAGTVDSTDSVTENPDIESKLEIEVLTARSTFAGTLSRGNEETSTEKVGEKSGTKEESDEEAPTAETEEESVKSTDTGAETKPSDTKVEAHGTLENIAEITQVDSEPINVYGPDMDNVFETCGMEVDLKLLGTRRSQTKILGLVEKESSETMTEEATVSSTLDLTENPSSRGGYTSDISGNDAVTTATSAVEETNRSTFLCGMNAAMKREAEKKTRYECTVPPLKGIGKSTSKKTIQDLLTYLKFRSRNQKGMVCPRNFHEDKCPRMFD
ncbi:unnamed protein product [Hermetia illucens]|uniref:Ropporin-1-like protein n=1 Tax=Hermetia illucens TaxID=343691 RepID=A0A7R8UPM7_HERIL|nr:uncharacterized protein LOC119651799 [Hermetia illucens]CAD7083767.1 unnamed protein product [Hermetia illucens]